MTTTEQPQTPRAKLTLVQEFEKLEKHTAKGIYTPGEAVSLRREITFKKLLPYFSEGKDSVFSNILDWQDAWNKELSA